MARLRVVKAILVLSVLLAPALAAAVGTLAPEAGEPPLQVTLQTGHTERVASVANSGNRAKDPGCACMFS
jgi:hypothetical protein